MKTINKMLLCCGVMAGATSCKKSMSPGAYSKYIEQTDGACTREIKLSGWTFNILYKPAKYILIHEGRQPGTQAYVEREKQLAGTVWFNVKITKDSSNITPLKFNVSGLDEYNRRLAYCLNDAQGDFSLVYDSDTLRPISYWFENNYDLTPYQTMVVGFTPLHQNKNAKMSLRYYDRLFGNGFVKAGYDLSDIEQYTNVNINH